MICPVMSRPLVQAGMLRDVYVQCKGAECMWFRKYMNWQCQEQNIPIGSGYCGAVLE
jgi:hypothetical protein